MMLNWDDSVINNMNSTELEEYEASQSNFGDGPKMYPRLGSAFRYWP